MRMKTSAAMKYGSRGGRRSLADTSVPSAEALPRQSIPGPSTFSGFFSLLVYYIVRKPLQISIGKRAVVYVIGICSGSLFFDLLRPPRTYFSSNTNLLNIFFVKWAWGWTLAPLLFFVTLSCFVYTAGRKDLMRAHLFRLLIATVSWYFWTNMFRVVDSIFGQCSRGNYSTKRDCVRDGMRWHGFDISGHTFLLVMCNMCIMEEVRVMDDWPRLGFILDSDENPQLRALQEGEIHRMRFAYKYYTVLIKSLVLILAVLTVLWDFMLCMTTIYFHTLPSKAMAVVISLLMWFVTYRLWFPIRDVFPGPPGRGIVKFTSS